MNELYNENNYVYRCALHLEGQLHLENELSSVGLVFASMLQEGASRVKNHRRRVRDNYQIGEPTGHVSHSGHRALVGNIALFPVLGHACYDFVEQTITDYFQKYCRSWINQCRIQQFCNNKKSANFFYNFRLKKKHLYAYLVLFHIATRLTEC